ncbi:hypothetical protein ACFQ08_17810 [Streptosporangium algeriense]|uniref:Uncharacterized protein n=1 Tax=Streptosporangium algeriense TaxID=1682748 RepID=A0ABW3DTT1_9ACTN
MLFGCALISTADQNPGHRIDALPRLDVDRDAIHLDKAGGAKASRPSPGLVLKPLRQGDALKVTRRLADLGYSAAGRSGRRVRLLA